jgi:hypothetical protein
MTDFAKLWDAFYLVKEAERRIPFKDVLLSRALDHLESVLDELQ